MTQQGPEAQGKPENRPSQYTPFHEMPALADGVVKEMSQRAGKGFQKFDIKGVARGLGAHLEKHRTAKLLALIKENPSILQNGRVLIFRDGDEFVPQSPDFESSRFSVDLEPRNGPQGMTLNEINSALKMLDNDPDVRAKLQNPRLSDQSRRRLRRGGSGVQDIKDIQGRGHGKKQTFADHMRASGLD